MTSDPRTVLIAVDGSEGSDVAVEWALTSYCRPEDTVQLLHVRQKLDDLVRWKLPSEAVNKMELQADIASRHIINRYMKMCAEKNLSAGFVILEGDARSELALAAVRLAGDCLVVGSRGQGRATQVRRALLGSTSDHVAHHCACPVIIVRAKEPSAKSGQFVCDDRLMSGN